MSKYIYNGWEFEQLPNQDTHPYWASYIYKTIYLDQAGDYRATLSDSPHRVTELYVANGVYLDHMLSTPGNGVELRLNANGDWVVSREFSPENYTPYGDPHHILVIDGEVVIWSNYAIYFDDGSLYQMAGATPYPVGGTPVDPDEPDIPDVPVEPEEPPVEEKKDFCLRSWLTGFCLGMAGKPLPFIGKKRLTLSQVRCSTIKFPVIYPHTSTWSLKPWNLPDGYTSVDYEFVWSDGDNLYYSKNSTQWVLNGDTWVEKTWNGLSSFSGLDIWTDGTNIYYSNYYDHYVLDGDTWVSKEWEGIYDFSGRNIWSDGKNIYHSYVIAHHVLHGNTWVEAVFNCPDRISGLDIWTDGTNIYYSNYSKQYVLNGDTWVEKTWNGLSVVEESRFVWSDGENTYYSSGRNQYVLNGDTWVEKTWNGGQNISVSQVISDGERLYAQCVYELDSAPWYANANHVLS